MIDTLLDTARAWPDKCEEIGFGDRQTELLAQLLQTRIENLRQKD